MSCPRSHLIPHYLASKLLGQSTGLGWEVQYLLWEPETFKWPGPSAAPAPGASFPLFFPQSHQHEGKLAQERAEVQGQVALLHSTS